LAALVMARVTITQQNWSAGELSKKLAGRYDLGVYYNGAEWMQNFIATVQGVASFRNGTVFVWNTRDNQEAILIPFEYNTEQAYVLEFTNLKMRIIKDGGLVTETPQSITGITKANPAVVTYGGADTYANGDRVVISGVLGMTQVNNREFIVANVNAGANTFELSGINSTAYGTYTSGGTVAEIVEVTTPYPEAMLFQFDYAQTMDTMYLVAEGYEPRKLTRSSHTAWTLSTYSIISNPFGTTKAAAKTITAATAANPVVITSATHGYSNGDTVFITGVVGMTQLNDKNYTVANQTTNTFELQTIDGTLYTAYTSGGTAEKFTAFSYPSVVAFFEQRLFMAASAVYQQRLWGSKAGASNYDNFSTGTGASDAVIYNIASGKANRIMWMVGTEDFLAIGTAGGEFKATGGGQDDAITPTNISIKPPSFYGSARIKPIRLDSHILYIQRDSMTTRSFEFDAIQDGYTSINRNLTSEQITRGRYGKQNGLKQLAYQSGFPSVTWGIKKDGLMTGLTFEPKEQVNGWHKHIAGGSLAAGKNGKPEYGSVATIPQSENSDQVYMVVKRTVNGATVRHIEYFADQPNIPQPLDYYTGDEESDGEAYLQDLWEAQKRLHYVDAGVTYDGSIYATQALTLSAATVGTGRTITAGGAIFTGLGGAALVGKEIWGINGGRAQITAYTDDTHVTVKITVAFPSVSIALGEWYLTADTFGGLQHLIGQAVVALADGGVVENLTVDANGEIELDSQHSYVVIGLKYIGIIKGMGIEGGGNNGPAQTKKKSLSQLGMKLLESLGGLVGTNIYKLQRIKYRSTSNKTSRPPPLFTGVKVENMPDNWTEEKNLFFVQDKPLPANIQLFSPYMTANDG
jgi:hypothetical protein